MNRLFLLAALFISCFTIGYTQPGSLDYSFGKNGVVNTNVGSPLSNNAVAKQVLVRQDGSIFIVFENVYLPMTGNGHGYIRGGIQTVITKKRADGSTDSTYGNNGFTVSVNISGVHAVQQSDGKIIIAGSQQIANGRDYESDRDYDFALARYNTNGSVDRSFGKEGLVTTDFVDSYGYSTDAIKSVAIQADGKIVVSGLSTTDIGEDTAHFISLARYNTNGSLDNTFSGGRFITPIQISSSGQSVYDNVLDLPNSAAIQSDGKIIVAGSSIHNGLNLIRYNSNGTQDSSFNVSNHFLRADGSYFNAKSLAVQADGKIVLGGLWDNSVNKKDFVIIRFNTKGGIDNSFDADGMQTTDFRTYDDILNAVTIQKDGKIIAVGYGSNGNNFGFAIAKYNTNGSLDNAFGKKLTFIANDVYATSAAIQDNGRIVVAGYEQPVSIATKHIALARYKTDGSLDNTLNGNGTMIDYVLLKKTVITKSAVQADKKIVVTGYYESGTNFIARYLTNGSLDNTFSADGIQPIDFALSDLVIQPDGKIAGCGNVSNGNNTDFGIVRYNTNGSIDNTFSGDGKATIDFGFNETAYSLAIQNDGKIVVVGESSGNFAIARFNANGTPDNTFSNDGKQTVSFSNEYGELVTSGANSVAIQTDQKIVAVGNARLDENAIAIARLNINGSLDNTFSQDGLQTTTVYDFGFDGGERGGTIEANSLIIQPDGKIVVGGSGGQRGRDVTYNRTIITRYNSDGNFDDSFSNNGRQEVVFSFLSRNTSIALQSNGKILVQSNLYDEVEHGYRSYDEVLLGYAVARLTADGKPDSVFAADGILYPNLERNTEIHDIIVADDKLYASGYSYDLSSSGYLARYLLTSPYVKIISPVENTVYAAPAAINVTAIASDEDGTIKNIKFYNNGTYLKTVSASPYTYAITNLPVGNYTLTAKATDNAGLESISQPVKVSVLATASNKAPVVKMTSPANNAIYNAPATITLNAAASDPDGTVSTVKFYRGGTLLATDSVSPYSYTLTNVASGNYSFTAKATDNKGLSSSTATVTVAVSVAPNKAPTISITNPVNNVVYDAPATININTATTDLDGTVNKIDFYNGGTYLGGISSIDNIKTYTFTLTNVAPGNYSFVAKATDNQGLKSSSATIVVQVVAANKAPIVSIASPANNSTYTAPATITVNALASDENGTISSVKFYNGGTYLKTDFTSPYSHTITNLPAGTYSLTAKATDNNGAETLSAPVSVTVATNSAIVSSKPYTENRKTASNSALTLRLSPNPATNIVNINTSGLQQNKPATLSIISVSGIVLKNMRISNSSTQLDVSTLVGGVYTIKIVSGNEVKYKQFVKL